MKLTFKMNLFLASVVVVLIVGLSAVFRMVVLESFYELDRKHAEDAALRCRESLMREIVHLGSFVHDWSSWDDTYRYVVDRNEEFIQSNITKEVFEDQEINLIHIYDASRRALSAKSYGMDLEREIDLDLAEELGPEIFAMLVDQKDPSRGTDGLVMTSYGPLLVSARPILTSENKGPARGTMVMGRFLSGGIMEAISQQSGVPAGFVPAVGEAGAAGDTTTRSGAANLDDVRVVVDPSGDFSTASVVIKDIAGRPAIVLSARVDRAIAGKGLRAYFLGLVSLMVLGVAAMVSVYLLTRSMVIEPIEKLAQKANSTLDGKNENVASLSGRDDEIGELARRFDALFGDLARQNKMLEVQEKRLAQIIDFLPDATYAVDREGVVIAWNRAMEEMTGMPKGEVMGRDHGHVARRFFGTQAGMLVDLVLGKPLEGDGRWFNLVREDSARVTAECHAPSLSEGRGAYLVSAAAPLFDEGGVIAGAIECLRDVTEKKRAEEVLERLGRTVEQLHDGVLMTGLDGTVIYANPAWASMHRLEAEEVCGRHVSVFHTEVQMEQTVKPFMAEVTSRGSGRAVISRITSHDEIVETLTSAFLLKDGRKNPTAIVWIARDITQETRMEEQLRQAQKMEVVGRLAGGVAHDLNNMLAPILGYAELVLSDLETDSPYYDDILQIRHAAERARDLTQQLLAFSRKQVLEMREVDLGEVVSGYAKMLRRTIREDIEVQLHQNICTKAVKIDVGRIGQVLMNLAINAQDAMPDGGTIVVEISQVTLDEEYARTHGGVIPGDYVVLALSDTGTGIDPTVMEHIFEPFFTTKEVGKGTGLGLATVYGIVRQHGGHISVYSEKNVGTTFRIYLPACTPMGDEQGREKVVEQGMPGSETIAVAEDDPHVRALACDILEKYGYRVITAPRAEELLDTISKTKEHVDLLLTDVIMPDINGKELFERVRTIRPETKVLFMSGYTGEIITRQGLLAEGVSLVQKPFTVASLTEKVRQVLDA